MLATVSLGDSLGDAGAPSRGTDWFRHPMPKKVDANGRWPMVPALLHRFEFLATGRPSTGLETWCV